MAYKKLQGIYAIEFDNGIKIGYTLDIYSRYITYLSPWCRPVKDFRFIECQYPKLVETKLKEELAAYIQTTGSSEFLTGVSFDEVLTMIMRYRFHQKFGMITDKYYQDKKLTKYIDRKFLTKKEHKEKLDKEEKLKQAMDKAKETLDMYKYG